MRTEIVKIYQYEELNEAAKASARNWLRNCQDNEGYTWWNDALKSIEEFSALFNVSIKKYEVSPWSYSYIDTDAENGNFRGLTLKAAKNLNIENSGYYLDYSLMETFLFSFEASGDALYAYNKAIEKTLSLILKDWEYQYSDEYLAENIVLNSYEFTEDGKIH